MRILDSKDFFKEDFASDFEVALDEENNRLYYRIVKKNYYEQTFFYPLSKQEYRLKKELPEQYNYCDNQDWYMKCRCNSESFHIYGFWEEGFDLKCTKCGLIENG